MRSYCDGDFGKYSWRVILDRLIKDRRYIVYRFWLAHGGFISTHLNMYQYSVRFKEITILPRNTETVESGILLYVWLFSEIKYHVLCNIHKS